MAGASIVLAVAALVVGLVVSGFAIKLQFDMFAKSSQQLQATTQALGDFRTELTGLIGELRGLTGKLVSAQEQQFDRMLDAFVERPARFEQAAEQASASAVGIEERAAKLREIDENAAKSTDIISLRSQLARLQGSVAAAQDLATMAARSYEAAAVPRVHRGMSQVGVDGIGRFPVDVVQLLQNVRRGSAQGEAISISEALKDVRGVLDRPLTAFKLALADGLIRSIGASRVELTERGAEFLTAIDKEHGP